jgi:FtsP/CotA-like multicopper oxidase with cupredoxin domain
VVVQPAPGHLRPCGEGVRRLRRGARAPGHGRGHGHHHGTAVADLVEARSGPPDREVRLTVRDDGDRITLNGATRGPTLRFDRGDLVEVTLVNDNLADGITLHWHGLDLPNAVDGVAGVTQDAVMPGESFVYRFVADQTGTYWYHSHQLSHNQVRRGLLGAVVVEEAPKRDVLAVLHQYDAGRLRRHHGAGARGRPGAGFDSPAANRLPRPALLRDAVRPCPRRVGPGSHLRLQHGPPAGLPGRHAGPVVDVNGHLFPDVPMFMVEEGDVVVMRIKNHSGESHPMHLHGHHALVLSKDGVPSTGSPWWVDSLEVGTGESWEIAFRTDNPGIWMDHCHNLPHAAEGLVAHLMYAGVSSSYRVGTAAGNRPE